MNTLISSIGRNKFYVYALCIVAFFALLGRLAMASTITPQQKAALDIPVQQKIIEENKPAFDAYTAASARLQQNLNCVQDASQCPLAQENTPARQ